VTATVAVSARYSAIDVVATPELKVRTVVEPNAIAVLEALTAVGAVPSGLTLAPENVRFLEPVYVVAVSPLLSTAVIVTVWVPPTVWDAVPVTTRAVAVPVFTANDRSTAGAVS
jgi:hypothetical protein